MVGWLAWQLAFHLVLIAQLALDGDQVLDVQPRGERLFAAAADRLLAGLANIAIELDAELRRPLENVKELAKRQPEQREDYGHRVRDRQEFIGIALEPRVADRQQQPRHADREEQQKRKQILGKVL